MYLWYIMSDMDKDMKKTDPAREAFLYLLMFLTLYISAISFGTLLFQFTNHWLPDPLSSYYNFNGNRNAIRMATASLIIAFPVFMYMSFVIRKMLAKDSERRKSRIRKWLTYMTLFAASGIIIGDLISLLFNFMGGDMTLRFAIKSLSVLIISGAIFGYYLWDLKQD